MKSLPSHGSFTYTIGQLEHLIASNETNPELFLSVFKKIRNHMTDLENQIMNSIFNNGDLEKSEPSLKLFEGVTGSTFAVLARSIGEAEEKYNAYFCEEPCPCGVADCKCFTWDEDDCDHSMEYTCEVKE